MDKLFCSDWREGYLNFWDKNKNFFLSISCFKTRTSILVFQSNKNFWEREFPSVSILVLRKIPAFNINHIVVTYIDHAEIWMTTLFLDVTGLQHKELVVWLCVKSSLFFLLESITVKTTALHDSSFYAMI